MERYFRFEIPESILADRQMTRNQYKLTSQYLRVMARAISNSIDWKKMYKGLEQAMLFGGSIIKYENLIKT